VHTLRVTTLDLQIRRTGPVVQGCRSGALVWVDLRWVSAAVYRWLPLWQQGWQQLRAAGLVPPTHGRRIRSKLCACCRGVCYQ
jgi:hypothetical protein